MKQLLIITMLLSLTADALAGGFRTNKSGRAYYCSSCKK